MVQKNSKVRKNELEVSINFQFHLTNSHSCIKKVLSVVLLFLLIFTKTVRILALNFYCQSIEIESSYSNF